MARGRVLEDLFKNLTYRERLLPFHFVVANRIHQVTGPQQHAKLAKVELRTRLACSEKGSHRDCWVEDSCSGYEPKQRFDLASELAARR